MPPKSSSPTKDSAKPRKRKQSRELKSTSPDNNEDAAAAKSKPKKPRAKKDKAKKDTVASAPVVNESTTDSSTEILDEVASVVNKVAAEEAAAALADPDPLPEDTVRMSITTDKVPGDDDTEITRTTLKLELPANSPDLELPRDTEGVVEAAREMLESAKELQEGVTDDTASSSSPPALPNLKRKADTLDDIETSGPEEIVQEIAEGDLAGLATASGEVEMRPAKRTRVMVAAEEYRREKVKRRALVGLSSALAIGVMVPFISNLF